jgi:hypothetical protein
LKGRDKRYLALSGLTEYFDGYPGRRSQDSLCPGLKYLGPSGLPESDSRFHRKRTPFNPGSIPHKPKPPFQTALKVPPKPNS